MVISALISLSDAALQGSPYRIQNFSMQKCNNVPESIVFENATAKINENGDLAVSGTMLTLIDIESPIKVDVNMKRKIIGMWIKVPCLRKLGSCIYNDVCFFGKSVNQPCPQNFERYNIPCRCPIPKGQYILPDDVTIPKELYQESIIKGKYKARAVAYHKNVQWACYDIKFILN